MRRILLIAALLFAASANAQSYVPDSLENVSKDQIKAVLKDVVKCANREYKIDTAYSQLNDDGEVKVYIELKSADKRGLEFIYQVRVYGANPSLEQKGTQKYFLTSIQGNYADIFPFWKKHFDSVANLEKTANTGHATPVYYGEGINKSAFMFEHVQEAEGVDKRDWIIYTR